MKLKPAIASADLTEFHDTCLSATNWAKSSVSAFSTGVWSFVEQNHRFNCLLWDEEDLARRKQVSDSAIAENKRAIDGYNQKRNDAIERIDEVLLASLAQVVRHPGACLNSETAGSIVDRLSILGLKIFHMRLQTVRTDVDGAHIDLCHSRLDRFLEQRRDLAGCLDRLLWTAMAGHAWFRVYRQFKMYNDPSLNPAIYGEKN